MSNNKSIWRFCLTTILCFLYFVFAANTSFAKILITYGTSASVVEINAAHDLANDIKKVFPKESIQILNEAKSFNLIPTDYHIILGNAKSSNLIKDFLQREHSADLKPETFILKSFLNNKNELYIAGADDRGTYYGVYQFSEKILKIDPLAYWTGKEAPKQKNFTLSKLDYSESAPAFPLRGYFDNDNDMLANWKGKKLIVELDTWKEMINSLARLRYNYIDIHDLLGRSEFYQWDYYKAMTNYHTDLKLVNEVIDYAHSKGMLVQIPMYLGWEFHHMDEDKVCLSKNMDYWMDMYQYYLTKTPLGKGDLFLQRPRHPYFDIAYNCEEEKKADIKTGPLMTEMFNKLYAMIKQHNPKAQLFCDLWREGRPMWQSGEFQPNKNIQMLWADYGVADFRDWPKDLQGYNFGIYIHAGVWQNQVTQNPYPALIKSASLEAVKRKMDHNYLVNGQSFKPFILNLAACAKVAWNPQTFDADEFYKDWTTTYFGKTASAKAIKSLKTTHLANQPVGGFREIMGKTVTILDQLKANKQILQATDSIKKAFILARDATKLATDAYKQVATKEKNVFDDQVLFPAKIYELNIALLMQTVLFNNSTISGNPVEIRKSGKQLQKSLLRLRKTLNKGSRWKKWRDWYNCSHFRVYTPPPLPTEVDDIIAKYNRN
nr:glycosyl hydrolase 115 family protein [uncultured Pedobacter sp.]